MFVLVINGMFNQVNGTVGVYLCLIVVLASSSYASKLKLPEEIKKSSH